MVGIREADLNRLLAALREGEQPDTAGDVRRRVLATITEVVGGDIVAYQSIDPATGSSEQVSVPDGWETTELAEVFTRHVPQHPLLPHFLRAGDLDAARLSDVATRRQVRDLGIYQDFYRPLGITHQLVCRLGTDLGVADILVFNRGGSDFTDAELQLVRLARPYLATVVATASAGAWFDSALAALEGVDDTAYGVVLLGPLGRIRVANRAARLLLSTYFRRPAREGGVVPEELGAWLARQSAVARPYVVTRGSRRLTVRLFRHRAAAALLLSEAGTRTPPVATAANLTARESDVLWLVAGGRTNAQAALALRISVRTVEKHLENAYAKLGATSKAEAAERAFGRT
ncbi:helix-turn-helix transcriptional regulator [Saccharothrix sp. S26]|uniref:helix-turn-helix transcriptional regulator n=1 Tax=Saccharothrix sp. S26 TaxID=2907215 RepID=UPI001F2D6268|nr:helix-turn-helix transcriptional regulator [Saccharothrix sp. S26]MCE6998341.1 helix-turn-helix transcriptional regulator [Saccharothrix sp. S26]